MKWHEDLPSNFSILFPPSPSLLPQSQTPQQQNSICMLMRWRKTDEPSRSNLQPKPAAFPSLTTSTIRAEYRHSLNVKRSHCGLVEKVRSRRRHPTPLTPELRASGLKQPPHHCALWWHSPVYLLQGKMGNTCRIGRDVLRGGAGGRQSWKCCAVAERQKRLALSDQSGSDSSRVLLVRPKVPRLIFESAPSLKEW